ncbi:MAG: 4-alpha-glucanotransferase [Rikenellaceae bacterium]
MKIKFTIEYFTSADEIVCISIDNDILPLTTLDGRLWSLETEFRGSLLQYRYSIYKNGARVRDEWGEFHQVSLRRNIEELHIFDKWLQMPSERALCSSLFTDVIFSRPDCQSIKPAIGGVSIVVEAPYVKSDELLVVSGASEQLGGWGLSRAIPLTRTERSLWSTPPLKSIDGDYKFAIVNSDTRELIAWEMGENHHFNRSTPLAKSSLILREEPLEFDRTPWRGAGVAVPVFSLRSKQSMGVGEFMDLKMLVDWAAKVGQKVIQILPINDTTMFGTWEDSYPYNANSSFALHPQYIAPLKVGLLSDKVLLTELTTEGERLNALQQVDYEAVNSLKDRYLRAIFEEIGQQTLLSREFKTFFKANHTWLEPYALFMHLRDKYKTPNFEQWGECATFSAQLLRRYTSSRSADYHALTYYYFLQYHLHSQLLETKEYAAKRGVAFKGDIPIGISRTSVDAWVNPHLFRLNSQAGAPPDDFSIMGQNWGFPTYNWKEMAKDGYAWWVARFKKMAEYFDAYRIDHILGFFRIWEIPTDTVHGLLGMFNPALPYSCDQIEGYGFAFDDRYATPYISDWVVEAIFNDRADEVKRNYLNEITPAEYQLKVQYSTQLKISEKIEDKVIKEGLLSLLDEVLFIEDRENKDLYHPRISAYSTYRFRTLSDHERECYSSLYNDFYYYRHNDFWRENALKKLPQLISATNMLTCGEDLGMIPHTVPEVMRSEQILSLEIQRMPKEPWRTFGDTFVYPYRSVCTTSTHDMDPIRAWWLEDKELTQQYYNCVLGFDGVAPAECEDYICEKIVEQHLQSPAMWTILPLQDWLSIDSNIRHADAQAERINIPANSRHYWQYRMHISIEELIEASNINQKINSLISLSGR